MNERPIYKFVCDCGIVEINKFRWHLCAVCGTGVTLEGKAKILKKYDVTISIIIVVEAEDKAEALDNAVVELEDAKGLYPYITDSEIVEIEE